MNKFPVIAGLDIGYGHTKYALRVGEDVVTDSFPSFAPLSGARSGMGTTMGRARVVEIDVHQKTYVVGPDSVLAADARQERRRDPAYPQSDAYFALTMGALAYMRQPLVDVLVLGLPLSTISTYDAHLEKTYCGKHSVPKLDGAPGELMQVEVREVKVAPQPAGALVATVNEHARIKDEMNLVIDLGYFTLDFLCAAGLRPLVKRSGAAEGGMAGFYDSLHEAATKAYMKQFPDLQGQFRMPHHRYEAALHNDPPVLRTSAGPLELAGAIEVARGKFDTYLDAVSARVGDTDDIENVILAGGGAGLMEPAFRARFPRMRQLMIPKNPQFAIARGLLAMGEIAAIGKA